MRNILRSYNSARYKERNKIDAKYDRYTLGLSNPLSNIKKKKSYISADYTFPSMDDKKIWRKSGRPEKVVLLSNLVLPSGSRGSSPSYSSVFSTSFKHETRLTLTDEHHCEGSLGVRARTRHAKSFNRAKGRAARPVLYRYRHTFYSVCTRTHI